MKLSKIQNLAQAISATALLLVTSSAIAAGPLALCEPGEPFLWPNGGANVPFNPDQGSLGVLDNTQAIQAVTDAFQAWADVSTATITYSNAGTLPVDVDVTNFTPFLEPAAPDGLSAIVFDDTGEIFTAIFGPDSGVLGFAGPEWIDATDCTILEGVSFLNGPAIVTLEGLLDLMVHEFGHYSNLAHSEVNGQLFIGVGDSSGPGSENTFGDPPFPDGVEVIETMYPFLFSNIDQLSRTPHADDRAGISQLYPQPDFAATTGTISGTILLQDEPVTGVNVIARNTADPFVDAVSGISSDFTDDFSPTNPLTGVYTLNGLTPGATYAVYVDEILDGGFSTPLASPLPGPEEFYNGANESGDSQTDIPGEFVPIAAAAGTPVNDIDIVFNIPPPGVPLPITDDGNVLVPLPFSFCVAGKAYDKAYINGNGFVTLGDADTDLTFAESAEAFLGGPPRIAGFWDDLNPEDGGTVVYELTPDTFSVSWDSVPEFNIGGANTFSIEIRKNSRDCTGGHFGGWHGSGHLSAVDSGDLQSNAGNDHFGGNRWFGGGLWGSDVRIRHTALTSTDGLVGVSAGLFAASGFETGIDLSAASHGGWWPLSLRHDAAVFEQFTDGEVDTIELSLEFRDVGKGYRDRFENNDSLRRAAKISLPFDSIDTRRHFTSISPEADDIDFFRFRDNLQAGTTLVAEVLTGQVDTVMGLYRCGDASGHHWHRPRKCDPADAELVAANDDTNGLLSRIVYEIPEDGSYALAVTFCCDFDFDGDDPGQGEPLDEGRYVLDAFVIDGVVLPLTDESFAEVELGFDFPYQGTSYDRVFVNSNGYLTFVDGEVLAFTPNVPDFENGLPRIAPLWVDLNPDDGGMIVAATDAGTATFSYMGVPEFFFGGSNTFSVTLDASGGVGMSYSGMTAPEGITGLAEGGGATGTAVDLSSAPDWPVSGTTYEEFVFGVSEFDLDGSSLTFE
jgi:hypothetical protein